MKRSKNVLAILMAATLSCCLASPLATPAWADDEPGIDAKTSAPTEGSDADPEPASPIAVGLEGLETTITCKASKTLTDKVTVTGSHAGSLQLQSYSSTHKVWKTKATYALSGTADTESVTLTYPSKWKKKMVTTWRVVIPAVEGYEQYVSPTITVTAVNIKTLSVASKALAIYRVSDGTLVYSKNANAKLPNASTTKMMTALIILEEGNLNGVATFSTKAAKTRYGVLGVKKGAKVRAKNLLKSLLITSSNDSATCLAEFSAGSTKRFAKKMNARARELGCTNTHFANPHGLTAAGHYSSARDLCVIQSACLNYSRYRKIIASKSWKFKDSTKRKYRGVTTDELLGCSKNFLGGKTGYTDAAGYCFSGVYTCGGETYVFTTLGSYSSSARWNAARLAMRYIDKYGK